MKTTNDVYILLINNNSLNKKVIINDHVKAEALNDNLDNDWYIDCYFDSMKELNEYYRNI